MVTTFAVGMWAGIASPAAIAYAASTNTPAGISVDTSGTSSPLTRFQSHSKQPHITHAKPIQVDSSQPFDGLGVLPFYTCIKFPIDDRVEALVNVANGNLIVHTKDLHITGTGIDESLEAYYNSQASFSRDHGNNWNFSFGHDVRLDLSNPTQGITLHGPTGYSAFFAYNSQAQTYTDPPGLNAMLVANQYGTYTLTFHNTGEQLVFGTNSHEAADKDKNGNTISYSYDSSHDLLSLTDTQGRVTTFDHNTVSGFTDPFPIPTKVLGLMWSILGDALFLIIALLIISAYHLKTVAYVIVAIIFVIISICIASYFYFFQFKNDVRKRRRGRS